MFRTFLAHPQEFLHCMVSRSLWQMFGCVVVWLGIRWLVWCGPSSHSNFEYLKWRMFANYLSRINWNKADMTGTHLTRIHLLIYWSIYQFNHGYLTCTLVESLLFIFLFCIVVKKIDRQDLETEKVKFNSHTALWYNHHAMQRPWCWVEIICWLQAAVVLFCGQFFRHVSY
jgi:hypothetical protein